MQAAHIDNNSNRKKEPDLCLYWGRVDTEQISFKRIPERKKERHNMRHSL